jgi:hypothetical protein
MAFFKNKNRKQLTLDEVTVKLSELRIPLSLVCTPVNLKAEKEKFFSSDTYNPQFKYRIVKNKNEAILSDLLEVKEITDVDPRISEFYIKLIEEKKIASDLLHSVGNNDAFTNLSIKKFRMPDDILYRNACRVLRGKIANYKVIDTSKFKKGETLNYEEVSKVFAVVFEELNLEGWNVEKSRNISNNGVKTAIKKRSIYVDPDIKKTSLELKKTVVHELTHVLRAYNGELSGFKALGKANLSYYLDVEEGLAMWNEEEMGFLKDTDLRERAAAVFAIYVGRNLSFRELYNILLGHFSRQGAFKITYLVKRGLGDTSLPGIYAKSVVYFRGFRKIKKRMAMDVGLYEKLYAGKISFSQVKWVDEGLIKEAKIIPTRKMFENAFKKAGI